MDTVTVEVHIKDKILTIQAGNGKDRLDIEETLDFNTAKEESLRVPLFGGENLRIYHAANGGWYVSTYTAQALKSRFDQPEAHDIRVDTVPGLEEMITQLVKHNAEKAQTFKSSHARREN